MTVKELIHFLKNVSDEEAEIIISTDSEDVSIMAHLTEAREVRSSDGTTSVELYPYNENEDQ